MIQFSAGGSQVLSLVRCHYFCPMKQRIQQLIHWAVKQTHKSKDLKQSDGKIGVMIFDLDWIDLNEYEEVIYRKYVDS